jgi:hypothetical protein
MKRNTIIPLLALSFCTLFAQDDKAGKIFVKGKVKDDKIYLRWAADDMFVLEQGLKHGFIIRRQTILRNNIVQTYPLTIDLPISPVLPKPLEQWEPHIDDDNFAIAAQALYGETFDVGTVGANNYSPLHTNPFMQAAQREQDRNQRLGFLLFACDQNFAVAEFSGLGLKDDKVNRDEKYLYMIFINDTSLYIDTGYCFIGLADVPDEPIMDDVLRARFSETQVTLRWDIRILKRFYSSYIIERSENGRDFKVVNDRPIVLLENPGTDPNEMVFVDSLPQRRDAMHRVSTYHYRIRGKDAFGDLSTPSNVVQGRSQRTLDVNPELLNLTIVGAGHAPPLQITWNIDPTAERDVAHFEIRSRTDRFGDEQILSTKIARNRRTITIPKPTKTCYITVVAIGNDGVEKPSLPILFQEEDNTPPNAPVGLTATIDTNGVVQLHWKPNTEDDLSGYRVFRANQATAEFIQITPQEIKDTVFFDTVSMNTSKSMFYRVIAVDFRGNQSQLSVACEAKRPVQFAPSAPAIVSYRLDGQTLFLKWANSQDEHVTNTQILICRGEACLAPTDNTWEILTTNPKTGIYDSATFSLKQAGQIKIALKSITPTQTSDFSNFIVLTVANVPPTAPELYTKLDREKKSVTLNWTTKSTEPIERIQVFRNELGQPPIALKDLSGNETQYIDTNLEEGKTYEYRIRIETETQTTSFSKKNTVKF